MTNQQHPLTPPPALVQEWIEPSGYKVIPKWLHELLQTAAQWGADQELDACCRELAEYCDCGVELTSGRVRELLMELRRPKPPSLAEEALRAHERSSFHYPGDRDTLRRALKRLQQLEEQQ